VRGIEVLHEDKRQPGVGRQMLQKLAERFQATGRCADADDAAVRIKCLQLAGASVFLLVRRA